MLSRGAMGTQIEQTFSIDAPPEQVSAAMRNPALIEESERSRDAVSVSVTDREKTDARHVYEVRVVSPARTVKGIDKSKTEENRIEVTWNLGDHTARWTWHGVHGPMVKIHGGYVVSPEGAGSRLKLYAEIDIALPLVGRMIEKKVREGFETNWPDYVTRVRKYARSA